MEYVSYEEFKKMDMRIGTIKSVELVEGADKLLRCMVDFGEMETAAAPASIPGFEFDEEGEERGEAAAETPSGVSAGLPVSVPKLRQIVSGIREFFPDYQKLVGKQVLYIINLEPRTIRGVESHGMLMAVDGKDGKPVFLTPDFEVVPGARVR